jgi:hypothetical protein
LHSGESVAAFFSSVITADTVRASSRRHSLPQGGSEIQRSSVAHPEPGRGNLPSLLFDSLSKYETDAAGDLGFPSRTHVLPLPFMEDIHCECPTAIDGAYGAWQAS